VSGHGTRIIASATPCSLGPPGPRAEGRPRRWRWWPGRGAQRGEEEEAEEEEEEEEEEETERGPISLASNPENERTEELVLGDSAPRQHMPAPPISDTFSKNERQRKLPERRGSPTGAWWRARGGGREGGSGVFCAKTRKIVNESCAFSSLGRVLCDRGRGKPSAEIPYKRELAITTTTTHPHTHSPPPRPAPRRSSAPAAQPIGNRIPSELGQLSCLGPGEKSCHR
jgi:hypothetical protein